MVLLGRLIGQRVFPLVGIKIHRPWFSSACPISWLYAVLSVSLSVTPFHPLEPVTCPRLFPRFNLHLLRGLFWSLYSFFSTWILLSFQLHGLRQPFPMVLLRDYNSPSYNPATLYIELLSGVFLVVSPFSLIGFLLLAVELSFVFLHRPERFLLVYPNSTLLPRWYSAL